MSHPQRLHRAHVCPGLVWSYMRRWVQDLPSEQLWGIGNLRANTPFNSSVMGAMMRFPEDKGQEKHLLQKSFLRGDVARTVPFPEMWRQEPWAGRDKRGTVA